MTKSKLYNDEQDSRCPPYSFGRDCQHVERVPFSVANSTPMGMVLAIMPIILLLAVGYYLVKSRPGMTLNVILGRPDGNELVQRETATRSPPSLITRSVFLVTQSRVGRLLSDGNDEEDGTEMEKVCGQKTHIVSIPEENSE